MEETTHVAPTEALLFIITCILIGISTKYFLSRIVPIPYTAILLVFGLAIGLIQGAAPQTHAFTATLSLWMAIDPHLLLLIFLPTIGFSAAIGQEPHLLRKNWGQILILAWPGVVVTFLLIAVCGKYFFPYAWTWPQALLFGAMLSATDPVAVVAVLHEVGADEKLANVIDGESLVNDGSALVIFLVLQQFVQGATLSAGQIVVLFLQLALLGAAVGLGFGLATSLWLSRIFNDPGLEIILTFGAAYSCYFVAEELLGASGLLAVVVMGFSMSLIGGRHITNRIKVEMHAFWEALEWLANTILFLWVGIALGLVLPPKPSHPSIQMEVEFTQYFQARDVGYAVVLYLWLLVARAVAVGVFYPIFSTGQVGYAMTWRTAVVMVWAGLRGAVGVAMSLFILFDPLISSDEYKAHCVLFMALMAFATVLINGSTAKYLLRDLGLLRMTPQQVQVLEHVLQEVDDIRTTKLQQLQPNPILGAADPAVVLAWTAVDAKATLAAAGRKLRRLGALSETQGASVQAAAVTKGAAESAVGGHGWRELVAEYRRRLLHVVKATYGELYQHFVLGTPEISMLQEATDEALDAVTAAAQQQESSPDPELGGSLTGSVAGSLTDWERLRSRLGSFGSADVKGRACGSCCACEKLLDVAQEQQAAAKLILLSAFVQAHTTAQELIQKHLAQLGGEMSDDESVSAAAKGRFVGPGMLAEDAGAVTVRDAGSDNGACLQQQRKSVEQQGEVQAARIALQESQAEVAAALAFAKEVVVPAHPQLASLLMSRYVAVEVLEEQLEFLNSIESAGLVKGEEVHHVQHSVNQRLEELQHERHWHLPPKAAPDTPLLQRVLSHGVSSAGADTRTSSAGAGGTAGPAAVLDGGTRIGHASAARAGSVLDLNYTASLRQVTARPVVRDFSKV